MRKTFIQFLIISILLFSCGKVTHEKFNSEKWKSENLNSEENWTLRWNMMNDLRNNHKIKGKTKNEIIELLGKPDNENKNQFYYYLGYSGNGINTGSLFITFDEDDRAINIKVNEG